MPSPSHRQNDPQRAPYSVVAFFLREGANGKEVLAISRKGKPDDLGLPGGKTEEGEVPLGALLREVREEVGIEITGSEMIYERVDPADGHEAWCYRVDSYTGEPRACEPNTVIAWVPPQRLLEANCTFREYNRGLFEHLGLVEAVEGDWTGFDPDLVIPRMSEEDLRKFVLDFLENRIFTDKHIRPHDYASMAPMVFMPLVFGVFSKYNTESLKQIGCVYAYMREAGPRSINGYPCFFSMHIVHIDDWARAAKAIEREEKRRESIEV